MHILRLCPHVESRTLQLVFLLSFQSSASVRTPYKYIKLVNLKGLQILFKWLALQLASSVKKFCRAVVASAESTGVRSGHRSYDFDSFLARRLSAITYAYSHLIKPKQY